jgi:citrate lyase subunit beta/citryl-CoA lyase
MTDPASAWHPGPAWLFCPADRPERYLKALERSDEVVVDLEDAVAPERKATARDALRRLAGEGVLDLSRTVVRVNGATTPDHQRDVALVTEIGARRVMLAKTERVEDLHAVPTAVVLLCESPLGVEIASELATADNAVALMWGADDFVAGLGGTSSRRTDGSYREVVRWARARCLVAAKAHGLLAVDNVYMDINDHLGLGVECEEAVAVGFDVKVAIHPDQVPVIRDAFLPSPYRVDWARRLLAAAAQTAGVFSFEGQMVDGPIFQQARQTLARAHLEES